jgi:SAM-dependent methyltransferase
MPSIDENKAAWDGGYDWSGRGDEWSVAWGGPVVQWYGTILPRIKRYVPVETILEIACGYGRWTQYLKDLCRKLFVVDISVECIEACRRRFSACSHIEYHVNDGRSLGMIPDSCVDFVFSFDSLVHADVSVLRGYVGELQRTLRSGGIAFLHHSNLGQYRGLYATIRKVPKLEGLLGRLGILEKSLHGRDFSVDAGMVEGLARDKGFGRMSQEVIRWGTKRSYIDCISTIAKVPASKGWRNQVFRNASFMDEAHYLRRLSLLYESVSHPEGWEGDSAPAPPPSAGTAHRRSG